jgi:outer membrane protein TolC
MQQEIVALRLERTTLAAALNTVLARSADAALVIPPGPVREGAAAIPGELPPFDSLAALAEAANPEIASAAAMLEGARTGERLARRMVWPDVGLGVAYGQRAGQDDLMSAMVSVTLPVFARSRQLRMRDEARAMRGASEAELAAMRLEVRGMLAAAYAEAQAARRQIAIYWGGLLPQAEASYTAALASYRVGRVDFMTALDAQMALLTYQRDLHRYETMHDIAVAEIDRLTGRSLTVADPSW